MKIKKFLLITIALLMFMFSSYSQRGQKSFDEYHKYSQHWKKVDSFDKKGLPKSALKIVDEIYEKAKDENNYPQLIKTLLHYCKFTNKLEEKSYVLIISKLENELKKSEFPNSAILNSIIAETYWDYFQKNRWKILNRTETVGYDSEDMETWDLKKLTEKAIFHFQNSLQNADSLNKISVNLYDEIILKGTKSQVLRPTLYDFLAHRTIDFFSNSQSKLTIPINNFQLKEKFYFSDTEDFIKAKISTKDSLSFHFFAIENFRKLLKYKVQAGSDDAIIDIECKRIEFVRQNSVNEQKDSLYLSFLNRLEKKYATNPLSAQASFAIAQFYRSRAYQYNPEIFETHIFKNSNQKAFDICKNIVEKFPKTNSATRAENLLLEIKQKFLSFEIEENIIPEDKILTKINYRNISKVYVRIAAISSKKLHQINKEHRYDEYFARIKENSTEIKNYEFELPNDSDFQKHSCELLIDGLPLGSYVVIMSNNPQFKEKNNIVAYRTFVVTNLSFIQNQSDDGTNSFYVLDRKTGAGIKNAKAQVFYKKYDRKARKYQYIIGPKILSDKKGFLEIPNDENFNDTRSYYIEFTNKNDTLISDRNYRQYFPRKDHNKPGKSTFFFTDRAIYRPGQTVHFKGIILKSYKNQHEIFPHIKTTVEFFDANYQKISELELKSNEFGTFSGSFIIPKGRLNGTFRLKNKYGSKQIQVEEYKRPKFAVSILPFVESYFLNDSVKVRGSAISYSGANLSETQVVYKIFKSPNRQNWWHNTSETEIAFGEIETDENGKFEFSFIAKHDLLFPKNPENVFSFRIFIDVTDSNGETQSTENSINIGYQTLRLGLEIPKKLCKENIKQEFENSFSVQTKNLNGNFVPAKGKIAIFKLEEPLEVLRKRHWTKPDKYIYSKNEWENLFAGNEYKNETEIENLKKSIKKLEINFDTKNNKSINLENISDWKTGRYLVELSSKDTFGNDVFKKQYFTLFSEKEKTCPVVASLWCSTISNKYEVGETAKIAIGSALKNASILLETRQENTVLHFEWIKLENEQKLFEIPILKNYRGNVFIHFTLVRNNRHYTFEEKIDVPYSNKKLDIEFETFRDKILPGSQEEWKITIKNKDGETESAEMLACLYDKSLDSFKKNVWGLNIYKKCYNATTRSATCFRSNYSDDASRISIKYKEVPFETYDYLNWFGFNDYSLTEMREGDTEPVYFAIERLDMDKSDATFANGIVAKQKQVTIIENDIELLANKQEEKKKYFDDPSIQNRSNFSETAFFYPHLQSDKDGNLNIKFTIPESLTKWKMLGFAHSKDLKYGFIEKELITQKPLMVTPNIPRFFREGDTIVLVSKISNLSEKDIEGLAKIEFSNPIDFQVIENLILDSTTEIQNFKIVTGQNSSVSWKLEIPEGISALSCKIIAKSENFSDAEEHTIPVLSNRILVTESLPLPIRGNETKTFELKKLQNSGKSPSLKNHKLSLEFTANPAWYAVQALPYLVDFPYDCAEQTFSKFYANSLAAHIANSSPKIKAVFDSWKNTENSDALLSKLEKNQELKQILIEETPWLLDAKNESESKQRIALLFDLNNLANELESMLLQLENMQNSSGAWPWFKGMHDNRFITQHIVAGFGHLYKLGAIEKNTRIEQMLKKALSYLDQQMKKDYKLLIKRKNKDFNPSRIHIHYLYARSFFKEIEISNEHSLAFNYFLKQAEKHWLKNSKYLQAMIALALHKFGNEITPFEILKSIEEHSLHSNELGMYWKENSGGMFWYEAPIETQALMIELFDELSENQETVEELKIWLLKQKQTQNWKTSKATTDAIYALLLKGNDLLGNSNQVEISVGSQKINPQENDDLNLEAGTGYFKKSWSANEISPDMGKVTVNKQNNGIAWGSLYWQYFEDIDKITKHETALKLKKDLFIEKQTDSGKKLFLINDSSKLFVGDKIIVRIELRVDRAMEYVHMKDMRASGFEPINIISAYKYQGGLGYYESTKDAATNFFISYLPKGTFVFEYPLRVSQSGVFSNGITKIQSMYAPEFSSFSEGIRIKVSGE